MDATRASKDGELHVFRAKAHEFYDRMRTTWERFIEDRMFAKVVQRLQKNLSPGALSSVVVTDDLVKRVQEGHGRCSSMNLGHDHAAAQGEQSYSLEDIKADLEQLIEADRLAKA